MSSQQRQIRPARPENAWLCTRPPATRPTLYFIGVTTSQSSIMTVFPEWARLLGLDNAVIAGMDFLIHDKPERYRGAVQYIRDDPLSLGALVTTHKLDLFEACRGMFDTVGEHAAQMAETSCISKRDGRLICHAKDPISSGLALDGFLPPNHFAETGAEMLAMGAGGSTVAIAWHLSQLSRGRNRPSRMIVTDRSPARLRHVEAIHAKLDTGVPIHCILVDATSDNDRLVGSLKPGSLVINATGLGKDAPGSPISDAAVFPERGIAWDLNYRGDLVFLRQARAQAESRRLQVEDGWTYFIHGWLQVIGEVFGIDIPTSGPRLEAIAEAAKRASGRS